MQIGTDFKAGNRIIIVLLSVWQGIKQTKNTLTLWFYPFFFKSHLKNTYL